MRMGGEGSSWLALPCVIGSEEESMHLSGREVASQFGKCASCRSAAASMRAAGTPASRSRIDPRAHGIQDREPLPLRLQGRLARQASRRGRLVSPHVLWPAPGCPGRCPRR